MTREELINKLSNMSLMELQTAYLYTVNFLSYGVNVTEKWLTATQNASSLELAYIQGYNDACKIIERKERNDRN